MAVHELHIWKLSGNKIIATAHVTCHNSVEYMRIATDLKELFHKRGIHSTTIQPEFTDMEGVEGLSKANCILECKQMCNPNTCCGQTNGQVNHNLKAPNSTNNNNSSQESNSNQQNVTLDMK